MLLIIGAVNIRGQMQFIQNKDLGFDEDTLEKYQGLIQRPQGMILVTGPTGSGKTSTLYASLNFLLSETAQSMIASFGREKYGRPLFYADGGKTEEQLLRAK